MFRAKVSADDNDNRCHACQQFYKNICSTVLDPLVIMVESKNGCCSAGLKYTPANIINFINASGKSLFIVFTKF